MESKQLRLSTERSGRPISDGAASAEAEAPGLKVPWREAEQVWQAIGPGKVPEVVYMTPCSRDLATKDSSSCGAQPV